MIDDLTLQITIDAPKAYFLAKLTYPTAFVVDRENVSLAAKLGLMKLMEQGHLSSRNTK